MKHFYEACFLIRNVQGLGVGGRDHQRREDSGGFAHRDHHSGEVGFDESPLEDAQERSGE